MIPITVSLLLKSALYNEIQLLLSTVVFNKSILNCTYDRRPVCDSPFQLGREPGGLSVGRVRSKLNVAS